MVAIIIKIVALIAALVIFTLLAGTIISAIMSANSTIMFIIGIILIPICGYVDSRIMLKIFSELNAFVGAK